MFSSACADDGAVTPNDSSSSSSEGGETLTTSTVTNTTTETADSTSTGITTTDTSSEGSTSVDSSSSEGESSSSESSSSESSSGGGMTCGNDTVEGSEVCDGTDLSGSDCIMEGFDGGTLACADDCSDYDTTQCVTFSCGNDAIEGTEVCDGSALGGETCISQNFDGGTLGCADDCTGYDTSACITFTCGNNFVEGVESCDGNDLGGETCASVGFDAGTLDCQDDCTFDTSGCVSFMCGNAVVEGMEVCDGAALNGETCLSQGFDAGTLACNAGCSAYDTSACINFACGNDTIEGTEACDGSDLGGEDCESQGFDSGTLGCLGNCSDFDTTQCVDFVCGNAVVEGAEACDGASLNGQTCTSLGFDAGTLACTGGCAFDTSGCVAFACGNDTIEGVEVCDGTDLGGETCVTQGFDAGTLDCAADCSGYDLSGCISFSCGNNTVEGAEVCDGTDLAGQSCATQGFDAGTLACQGNCSAFDTSACTDCGDFVIEGTETCEGFNLNGATCATVGFGGGYLYCNGTCGYNTAQCFAQVSEIEPNDDGATATGVGDFSSANANGPFNDDILISAAINPAGDEDVFAVTNALGVNQTLTVQTWGVGGPGTCAAGTDTVVTIRDAAGTSLASNDDGGIPNCSLIPSFILTPGQTVYVHVIDYQDNGAIASYYLQLNMVPVGCGNGFLDAGEQCDDRNTATGDGCNATCNIEGLITEIEPNGTTAQADATGIIISDGNAHTRISGAITPLADHDLFRIQVAADGILRLETFSTLGRCNITTTMTLRNAAGAQILTDNTSGISACSAITYPIPAGTYYVDVNETGDNALLAQYILEASFVPSVGSESEVNDTIPQANFLTQSTDMYVFGDHTITADADYYAIYVPHGASLKLETIEGSLATETCESMDIDSTIALFTAGGTQLIQDDDSGRGYCSMVDGTGDIANNAPPAHALVGGLYYVRVQASGFAAGTQPNFVYRLVATIRTP